MRFKERLWVKKLCLTMLACFAVSNGWSQDAGGKAIMPEVTLANSIRQLQESVQQLGATIQQLKEEGSRQRAMAEQLEQELRATRNKLDSMVCSSFPTPKMPPDSPPPLAKEPRSAASAGESSGGENPGQRIAKLEESQQLLAAGLAEQYQTKVESASKYRLKLSGMVLMNLFSDKGNVDSMEFPAVSLQDSQSATTANTGGSFGATLRQSEFGIEVHGPSFAGASTQGNFMADFSGDFPDIPNGFSSGALRIRTATVRLDWPRTSIVVGQDHLFFSPLRPTSFASLAISPLEYAGNLYAWVPQVRVERRFSASDDSTITLSGGILDPLTGETPNGPTEFLRLPTGGEASRQPGYATRLDWSRQLFGRPLAIGVGGYYSREIWGFDHHINGWAGTADATIPLQKHFSISGKFFSGQAIGGLGAALGHSVLVNGPFSDPTTSIKGTHSTGGWAQFTFVPTGKLEFNAAAGQDGVPVREVRGFTANPLNAQGNPIVSYFPADLTRNRSEFVNFVYRPRSDLLFSAEFRKLQTFKTAGASDKAQQINLMMGIIF